MKKVLVVGSISQSPFIQTDIDILSTLYKVDTLNITGTLPMGFSQYYELAKTMLFKLLPKCASNDVIFVWFADVPAFVCLIYAILFRKKLIVEIGGYEVCNMPEINYGLQRGGIRGFISRIVMRYADHCIVPSNSYYKRSSPYCKRVHILPTCINIVYPEPIDKENIIVMVGSATKNNYALKGIPLYNCIADELMLPCYLIGSYEDDVKLKYNNLTYLGQLHHNEVIDWMNKAKFYCQLSYTESFGISIMEAMSVGCIPVVSDVDDIKSLINHGTLYICSNDRKKIVDDIIKFSQIKTNDYRKNIISSARLNIFDMCRNRKVGFKFLIGEK